MNLAAELEAVAAALTNNVDELTRLDSITGDGDLGTTAGKVAVAIREAVESRENDTQALLILCGKRIAGTAASSCGTLIATAFLSAAKAVGDTEGRGQLAAGLEAAVEGIQKRGKAGPGDRTMIDALAPAAEAAAAGISSGTPGDYLQRIADAARQGMLATQSMTPKIGRARSQPERALGNPDAGAVLVSIALSAAFQAASGVLEA